MQLEGLGKAIFEAVLEGMIVADEQGRIVLVNQRAEEMLGFGRDELVGEMVEVVVPSRMASNHYQLRQGYHQHPSRRTMGIGIDLAARRKDGSEIPVEISLNHFTMDGAHFAVALISDITRRKEAERALAQINQDLDSRVQERTRALAESKHLYEVIARNFPNGAIMVFDKDFNYVFAEGRELYRMGVTSQELVGSNYLDRLEESARQAIEPRLREAFNGNNSNFDIVVRDKHYELQAVPLRDIHGLIDRILVVETNVTAQKRAEKNIMEALEKERHLNEMKSRFVSMASHEFRTPLSTILTSLSLATRYHGAGHEANLAKHYARIRSSVHNLTNILNDFLSLDKLESGLVSVNPDEFNLRNLLDDLVDEMQAICKDGQLISVQYEGDEVVFSDPNMVRNIAVNLISNAIKYSEEKKPIEVIAEVKDGKTLVHVRDHGIGIPDGDQRHMFERFFRAHNAINIQGTGLGLNIVKKYVDLLGGDIWFESQVGAGTTFTFVIPQHLVS